MAASVLSLPPRSYPGPESLKALSPGQVCDGILDTVGKTPLVLRRQLIPGNRFRLYAKFEALNPGGSVKDRPALAILREALRSSPVDSLWLDDSGRTS